MDMPSRRLAPPLLRLLPASVARRCVAALRHAPTSPDAKGGPRTIYVDVSLIAEHDAGTGIQRVVREMLLALLELCGPTTRLQGIVARAGHTYVQRDLAHLLPRPIGSGDGQTVRMRAGDIFLGLDFCPGIVGHRWRELLEWKRSGASIQFVAYDMLPWKRPTWFTPRSVSNFRRWFRTVATFADIVHCISNRARVDVMQAAEVFGVPFDDSAVPIFHPGADFHPRTTGASSARNRADVVQWAASGRCALMVGTVEPRKGHAEVLQAFEAAWQAGDAARLLIVGRPGWRTDALQRALREHRLADLRMRWVDDVDDELLTQLYRTANGLIAASLDEGLGLPLLEARHHGLPVLARDIPVFRDAVPGARFYPATGLSARVLRDWLDAGAACPRPTPAGDGPTWRRAAEELLGNMTNRQAQAAHA